MLTIYSLLPFHLSFCVPDTYTMKQESGRGPFSMANIAERRAASGSHQAKSIKVLIPPPVFRDMLALDEEVPAICHGYWFTSLPWNCPIKSPFNITMSSTNLLWI